MHLTVLMTVNIFLCFWLVVRRTLIVLCVAQRSPPEQENKNQLVNVGHDVDDSTKKVKQNKKIIRYKNKG